MQIFNYGKNGEFLFESTARLDPVAQTPVLPANATSLAPPHAPAGQAAQFDTTTGQWQLVPDYRGLDHWDSNGNYLGQVQELGDLPAGATFAEPEPTLAELKAAKLVAIQAEKKRVRDAGFMVEGVLFDSDLPARTAYLELASELEADSTYTAQWKANPTDWVTMDATLFAKVRDAGKAHIAAVFAWQAARSAEVEAATTAAEVGAVSSSYA